MVPARRNKESAVLKDARWAFLVEKSLGRLDLRSWGESYWSKWNRSEWMSVAKLTKGQFPREGGIDLIIWSVWNRGNFFCSYFLLRGSIKIKLWLWSAGTLDKFLMIRVRDWSSMISPREWLVKAWKWSWRKDEKWCTIHGPKMSNRNVNGPMKGSRFQLI